MYLSKPPEDIFEFSGGDNMSLTLNDEAVTDLTARAFEDRRIGIPDDSHGYVAGSLIYIQNTTNYNGLHYISAVSTDRIDILLGRDEGYTAETLSSATGKPIVTYDEDWELLGFELHLDTACGTAEDFAVNVDTAKGAAWDTNLYTKDMDGIKDIVLNWSQPRPLRANDLVIFSFLNTDDNTWGLKVIARRKA